MDARVPIGGILLAALVLAGCQDTDPLMPTAEDVLAPVTAQQRWTPHRPFAGHFAGTLAPGAQCGAEPWEVNLYVQGEGIATHLGVTTLDLRACYDMSTFTPVGPVTATFTGADGDEVWMIATTFDADPTSGVMTADYDVVGGTGRFQDAEGDLAVTGQNYPDNTWTTEVTGWIAY
ncbi:MAG TPA: hypothetical protein VE173_11855 [Longimicrobiales bacterium]|nr:hypothetical protein [Longimicrobiales bacterium]